MTLKPPSRIILPNWRKKDIRLKITNLGPFPLYCKPKSKSATEVFEKHNCLVLDINQTFEYSPKEYDILSFDGKSEVIMKEV